jgi:hypothetical protein
MACPRFLGGDAFSYSALRNIIPHALPRYLRPSATTIDARLIP